MEQSWRHQELGSWKRDVYGPPPQVPVSINQTYCIQSPSPS